MKYSFKVTDDLSLVTGGACILGIHGDFCSGEEIAKTRGAMLALFGEPPFTSNEYEDAYEYMIIATNTNGNSCLLSVYQDHIGSCREEDDTNIIKEASVELANLICQTKPADFEAITYDGDTNTNITYGCKNGIPYYDWDI